MVISPKEIKCTAPPHTEGLVYLDVSVDGVYYTQKQASFLYERAKVEVGSAAPPRILNWGPREGYAGTVVLLYAEGLQRTPQLGCKFGEVRVPAEYVSSTSVLCQSPSRGEGTVQLDLTVNGIDWTGRSAWFRFLPLTLQPDDSLAPHALPTPAEETDVPREATLPEGTPEEEEDAPVVDELMPPEGFPGTTIRVTGRHFLNTGKQSCRFGSQLVAARFLSPTVLQCEAPQRFPGPVFVEVTNDGDVFSHSEVVFLYHEGLAVPTVKQVDPPTGTAGCTVWVYGANFVNDVRLVCRVGAATVAAEYVSSTAVKCRAPDSDDGVVEVQVANNAVDFSKERVLFTYDHTVPVLLAISPRAAVAGTAITVIGRNFPRSAGLLCHFGSTVEMPASYISDTQLLCTTPRGITGFVAVEIADQTRHLTNEVVIELVLPPDHTVESDGDSPSHFRWRVVLGSGAAVAVALFGFVSLRKRAARHKVQ